MLNMPQPRIVNIMSTRARTSASGSIQVKVGFVRPDNVNHALSLDEIYEEIVRRARSAHMTLMSAPPVRTLCLLLGSICIS